MDFNFYRSHFRSLKLFAGLLLTIVVLLPNQGHASIKLMCSNILGIVRGNSPKYVQNKVEIIFYPAKYHIEISIDGEMFNAADGFLPTASIEAVKRAARSKKSGIIAFQLRVTEKELEDLKAFVKQDPKNHQTCISGVCSAINKNTGMTIPFPINYFPSYTALYLALKKITGTSFGRLTKVEFMGNTGQLAFGIPLSLSSALFFSSVVTYATVETTYGIFTYVVPVLLNQF